MTWIRKDGVKCFTQGEVNCEVIRAEAKRDAEWRERIKIKRDEICEILTVAGLMQGASIKALKTTTDFITKEIDKLRSGGVSPVTKTGNRAGNRQVPDEPAVKQAHGDDRQSRSGAEAQKGSSRKGGKCVCGHSMKFHAPKRESNWQECMLKGCKCLYFQKKKRK